MEDEVRTCNGCGMNRLCREFKGFWLCVKRCFRHRDAVIHSRMIGKTRA